MKDKVWAKAIADACATKQLHLRPAHVPGLESNDTGSHASHAEEPVDV